MMTSFTVSSGRIPAVGYGCWKVPRDRATELVEGVIRAGYRHIDGACDYGNEKEVSGSLIRSEFDLSCDRSDLALGMSLTQVLSHEKTSL